MLPYFVRVGFLAAVMSFAVVTNEIENEVAKRNSIFHDRNSRILNQIQRAVICGALALSAH